MLRPASVWDGLRALLQPAAVLLVLACSASGGPGDGPDEHTVTVNVVGRVERGSTVSLEALLDGTKILLPDLVWSAEPASAVEFLSSGEAKLLKNGYVTITASSSGHTGFGTINVAIPPRVLFDQVVSGNRDIYSVAIDGGDARRLTSDGGDDRDASPDGSDVWFTSYRNGNGELYQMSQSGFDEVRKTTTTPAEEREIAFLSVGGASSGRMAYTSNATGVAKLWVASPTVAPAQAAPSFGYSGSIDASPSWSAAGDIVFMSTAGGQSDLYRLAAGAVTHVDVGQTPNFEPAFRADGAKILFGSSRGGPAKLYVYDVALMTVAPLTTGTGDDGQGTWLGDGRVVFTSWRSGSAQLYWVDPAAPDVVHLIPTSGTDPQRPSAW